MRILLAEDNVVNTKITTTFLVEAGYQVESVDNGVDALKCLIATTYDVILLDLHMPGMDGLGVVRNFRAIEKVDTHTPVIALTAETDSNIRHLVIEAGMDAYLAKPFDARQLVEKITTALPASYNTSSTEVCPKVDSFENTEAHSKATEKVRDYETNDELTSLFIKSTNTAIENLSVELANRNYQEIRKIAHCVKGASLTQGAQHLVDILDTLEQLPDDFPKDMCSAIVASLVVEFEIYMGQVEEISQKTGDRR